MEVPDHGADVDVVLRDRSLVLPLEGLAVLGRVVAARRPALRRRGRLVHVLRALVLEHLAVALIVSVRQDLVAAARADGRLRLAVVSFGLVVAVVVVRGHQL